MGSADPVGWTSLGDVLREHRRSRGSMTALVDGKVRLDYVTLDDRVTQWANVLSERGVGAGERVLWIGQNSFRLLETLLACAKLGALLVPVNWRQSAAELAAVIDDVNAAVVLWQKRDIGELVERAHALATTDAEWIQHDSVAADGYEAVLATGSTVDAEKPIDPDLSVLGIYTAAFGGRPHAAALSHRATLIEGLVIARIAEISDETVFLNSGPLFHLGTLMTTLATFLLGGTNVVVARTEAEEMCEVIDREKCNRAFIMAPTVEAMREANQNGRWDLRSLWPDPDPATWTMCTPSANPTSGRAGGYGQSEVTGLITSYGLGSKADSIYGRTTPLGQVRIVDAAGVEVPTGETGEIICRGPVVMNGYLNRDELNAERRLNGWHRTGDLGRREKDGSITFVGPMMKMIKSASENIYPIEVERCLGAHPAVSDVVVLGVPDQRWTQSVKAVVVTVPGTTVTGEELIEYCREHIASYKKPRFVTFATALPKTKTGQVDRDAVDREYGGGGYPGQVSSGRRDVPVGPATGAVAR
ncbi:AMP-binding protein [Nocardia sp. NPDC047654]|uniref:AMP-binding protein n=1 Tax=Nocardia sp. NPDC047654 TaxID=3364314 RepID=UPI0037173BBC